MLDRPRNETRDAQATASSSVPRPVRRRHRRRWPYALLVLALLAGAGAYGWQAYSTPAARQAVVTDVVARGDIENSVTAAGLLSPIRDVDVGARVSGQLKRLAFSIGDQVKEGDLVAELDSASIETQIEVAEAELANLKAQMTDKQAQAVLAESSLSRQRDLVASNSAARSALDQAVAALATAHANVASLEAQIRKQEAALKDARISLGYTKIYAPMAGTIVDIPVKEGQTLNANQSTPTIATIADLSTMTVEAQVSEADISRLAVGMKAYFTLLGQSGRRHEGTLRQIKPTPTTENNVVLYYALFDVPNPDGALMMNMTAQVFFVEDAARDVLTIPAGALKSTGRDTGTVTVVKEGGAQESREIRTGVRSRVRVEVTEGLAEGERVVVPSDSARSSGQRGMRGGMRGMPPPMF
ncbi:efflux RND transporter periplasmic adaptor subunit [Ensifer soli]|uniref:efflux RND transporter periplasmic adaptor subunit n=1 Tax=Ciceribacter sp. sgz301302 TaxID=3342379 RepID=UPI0035B9DAAE